MELPDDHELIWLFEQEPTLSDPGRHWYYNHLTFTLDRGDERLVCMIAPAHGDVQLHLSRGGRSVFDLILGHVTRLTVWKKDETEALIIEVGLDHVDQLELRTKPAFHVRWGTALIGSD